MSLSISVCGTSGRIWVPSPVAQQHLVPVLSTAASKVSGQGGSVRPVPFTCAAWDSRGEHLAAVDSLGTVYVFLVNQNRYVRLDKAGSPAIAAAFSRSSVRQLYISFAVG